jgi:hypothetical protein
MTKPIQRILISRVRYPKGGRRQGCGVAVQQVCLRSRKSQPNDLSTLMQNFVDRRNRRSESIDSSGGRSGPRRGPDLERKRLTAGIWSGRSGAVTHYYVTRLGDPLLWEQRAPAPIKHNNNTRFKELVTDNCRREGVCGPTCGPSDGLQQSAPPQSTLNRERWVVSEAGGHASNHASNSCRVIGVNWGLFANYRRWFHVNSRARSSDQREVL